MKKVTKKEILAVISFYLFFSMLYRIVLWYNGGGYDRDGFWGWATIEGYWFGSGMQYVFYFFASILIWFSGVYLLRHKKVLTQIVVVAILIPISVLIVRDSRYVLIDYLGTGRLTGTGEIWDWYIPTLFMFIQFGCYFAYRYFKENQRKLMLEGELRNAALKSELSAIKAQLNPHFLYNVFNTINASIPVENEKTRDMIAQLSDLFRYQLKATKEDLVPLNEELTFVKKYLDLEKARFEDRLKIVIEVPQDLLNEKIPPMLLQPIVENSVKHGLSSLIEGGEITIKIFRKGDKLMFEIADTGVGVENKDKIFEKGIGLANTRLRLQKMYNSTLEIIDNNPKGLKVRFAI